ncbi:hypothetical protein [Nocardiopsis sp. CNT312]|uniref:hypothetical protein n=1 Tax=Nocardiopsis sp. CNT312 TaxID=1137268 RepID=UPI00048A8080|nr:hypothetical protein [Nocardiopsis sp. CNT312]
MRRQQRNRGAFLTRAAAVTVSAALMWSGQVALPPAASADARPPAPERPGMPSRPGVPGGAEMPGLAGFPEHPVSVDVGDAAPGTEGAPLPGAINLEDHEGFDTGGLMGGLCAKGPNKRVEGAFNNETGAFLPKGAYVDRKGHFRPDGPWETVRGRCHFPVLGAWDHPGVERRITAKHRNLGTGDDYYEFTIAYGTAFEASTSTGRSVSKTVADDIFSTTKTTSHDHSWAWGFAQDVSRLRAMIISPCTEVWLSATPIKRTVRVHPVFEVFDHGFHRTAERTAGDDWRVADDGSRLLFAPGFHIDGTADRLLLDGTPDLLIQKHQINLDDDLCA